MTDADRARQRCPAQATDEAGPAAVPRPRLLPRTARALGLPRSGLRRVDRRRIADGPDRRAVRPAAGNLRLRRPRLRALHLPPLRLGLRPRLHRRPRGSVLPVARAGWRVPDRRPGSIPELLATRPAARGAVEPGSVEPAELDLVTGRLNPHELGDAWPAGVPAEAAQRRDRHAATTTTTTATSDARPTASSSRAASAAQSAGFGRSSVQDHQTKGDQPFQALVTRQIEVQPPGRSRTRTSRRSAAARCWPSPTRARSRPGLRRTCRPTRCGTSSGR